MIRRYWTTVFGELHGHGRTTRQDRGQMGRVMLAQVMNRDKSYARLWTQCSKQR